LPSNIPPPSDGDKKGGACAILEKKNSSPAFLLRQLKNFDHHPMVWMCWMVIKKNLSPSNNGAVLGFFWSLSDTPALSDGDYIFWSPKNAWREGHEMIIRKKGREKKERKRVEKKEEKKAIRTRGR